MKRGRQEEPAAEMKCYVKRRVCEAGMLRSPLSCPSRRHMPEIARRERQGEWRHAAAPPAAALCGVCVCSAAGHAAVLRRCAPRVCAAASLRRCHHIESPPF